MKLESNVDWQRRDKTPARGIWADNVTMWGYSLILFVLFVTGQKGDKIMR